MSIEPGAIAVAHNGARFAVVRYDHAAERVTLQGWTGRQTVPLDTFLRRYTIAPHQPEALAASPL